MPAAGHCRELDFTPGPIPDVPPGCARILIRYGRGKYFERVLRGFGDCDRRRTWLKQTGLGAEFYEGCDESEQYDDEGKGFF
jgi:hypothetical protein